ncbi:two-component system response regulator YesN [Hydrogenispora ethanolica]|uniref:Two-component system response regulator YesN n=1 Tax=Hydrogenispora ethanolica TaxID=1082276 RepID=A0A4R1R8J6_HYDET|nr:response regulator [Hydrogenispora ethanolica]TCL61938.1 two-component system response regulator YesN [Hydrogenispora ethanolica]
MALLKIVIVDDEKMIRESMAATFPWHELGIEVAGTAENGLKGLELVAATRPHIILTDIRMPRMDGLEFIKRVRETLPDVKIIILSGYDEFSYAQKALRYGVSDYILKPVGAKELTRVMQKLVQEMEAEFSAELFLVKAKQEIGLGLEAYLNSIRLGDGKKAGAVLDEIVLKLMSQKISPEQLRKVCLELSNQVLEALQRDGIPLSGEWQPGNGRAYQDLRSLATAEELYGWLRRFTAGIARYVEERKDNGHHVAIQKALQYIDGHYAEELSVKAVAEQVCLSPDYFSHIFKKVRGESFTDYLNQVRIRKATELLANNLYKVYEVSDMVGYSDYKYFSSVFKKITGVSPTDYHGLQR